MLAVERRKADGRWQMAEGIHAARYRYGFASRASADSPSHLAESLPSKGHNPPLLQVTPVQERLQSPCEQNLLPSASCPLPLDEERIQKSRVKTSEGNSSLVDLDTANFLARYSYPIPNSELFCILLVKWGN